MPYSFGMPSGFVRDFTSTAVYFRKRDSKLFNLPILYLERTFRLT